MNDFKTYKLTPDEKQGIISVLTDELEKDEKVLFAYIYGSFVDPEMEFFRDIDVGVYVDENVLSANQFLDYGINVSLKMESLVRRFPVDVVIMNNAPLALAFRITQGKLLFTLNEDTWLDFVTKIWGLYHDHAITSRHVLEEILRA